MEFYRFLSVSSSYEDNHTENISLTPFISLVNLQIPHSINYLLYNGDTFFIKHKRADECILEFCKYNPVDVVWLDVQQLPGKMDYNFILKMADVLMDMGIVVVFIWADSVWCGIRYLLRDFSEHCSFIIVLDNPFTVSVNPCKIIWMWSFPNDFSLYRHPKESRDVDVSFAGLVNAYPDRVKYLDYLNSQGVRLFVCGADGYGQSRVVDIFHRSKIALNFSLVVNGWEHQLKCRTIEVPAGGALLLESDNPLTSVMYTPMKDYVPFTTPQDLLEKINFYLVNEEERLRIAINGHEKCIDNYNMSKWWNVVFDRIGAEKLKLQKQKF